MSIRPATLERARLRSSLYGGTGLFLTWLLEALEGTPIVPFAGTVFVALAAMALMVTSAAFYAEFKGYPRYYCVLGVLHLFGFALLWTLKRRSETPTRDPRPLLRRLAAVFVFITLLLGYAVTG